jgi:hypothetical protein
MQETDTIDILPGSFQKWLKTKSSTPQDLRFLSLLKSPEQVREFFELTETFYEANPTFTEGLQVLEVVVDLILLNRGSQIPKLEILESNNFQRSILIWRNHLFDLRNPNTKSKDEIRKAQLEALKWPPGSKIKVERRGDRHGAEFRVFISSSSDLTKVIANLESLKNDFPV